MVCALTSPRLGIHNIMVHQALVSSYLNTETDHLPPIITDGRAKINFFAIKDIESAD